MTEVNTPLAGDDPRKPRIPILASEPCGPPIQPAIWPCEICPLFRTCLYDYRPGMTLPAYPIGCQRCGDAIVNCTPEVMQ